MKIRLYFLMAVVAGVLTGHLGAMSHYELLNVPLRATTDDIRKRCMSADVVVSKRRELEAAKPEDKERVEKKLNEIYASAKKQLPRLQAASSEQITEACEILQDPQKKSAYDAKPEVKAYFDGLRAAEGGKEELKPHVASVFKGKNYYQRFTPYLTSDAKKDEIDRLCTLERDKRKKDVEDLRKKLPPDYQSQRYTSIMIEQQAQTFEIEEQKLKLIDEACTTLSDPTKRKEYDEKLEKGEFDALGANVTGFKANTDVLLVDIVGNFLTQIPIPDVAFKLFNKDFALRNMSILKAPSGFTIRTGLGFTGTTFINKFGVKATVYVVRDMNRKMQYSLSLELPEHYKISDLFPDFKKLDQLSLPRIKLVASTFEYFDPDGFTIKPGFNFNSILELKGPLKLLGNLMDQSKKLKSVVVRAEPIRFQGMIPRDIRKASFSAKIPLYIGVDFTKIPKMPHSVTDVIKEITTDDFELVLTAPPRISFTVEAGVRLVLTRQRDPIRLSGFAIIEPTSFSLGMRMRNMLEFKWIALGNAGIQLDFDEFLLPVATALGMPFTGLGINGQIEVGKRGDHRVTFKVAGGFRLASTGIPDLVFDVSALNLRFSDLLKLLVKVATKKGHEPFIELSKIPVMHLENVRGYMALKDTKIAGRQYYAGFGLEVDALLFNRRAGFSFDLKQTMLSCSGSGYMSSIDIKRKDKTVFRLSGPPFSTKAGKMVEGPAIDFSFGFPKLATEGQFKKALEGRFGVRGILEIPGIALKQAVDLEWSGWNLRANFETIFSGFTVVFGVQIMLKSGMESKSAYDMLLKEVEALIEQKDDKDPDIMKARELLKEATTLFREASAMPKKDEAEAKKASARQRLEEARELALNAKPKEIVGGEVPTTQLEAGVTYIESLLAELELLLNAVKKSTLDIENAKDVKKDASRKVQQWKGQVRKTLTKEERFEIEKQIIATITQLEAIRVGLGKIVPAEDLGGFFKAKEHVADPGKKFREMYIKFGFKGDFAKFMNERAIPAIKKLQKKSSERLGKLNKEVGEFSQKVKAGGLRDAKAIQGEISKFKRKVDALKREIEFLKKQRNKEHKIGKKAKLSAKIASIELDIKVKQIYIGALLKPGKAVIKGASIVIAAATEALYKAKLLKKVVEKMLGVFSKALTVLAKGAKIFHFTEAIGEWSWLDIKNLRAPRLISFIADIEIPGIPKIAVNLSNLQFDFKRIGYSVSQIVQQVLLGGIRIGGEGGLGGMLGGKA